MRPDCCECLGGGMAAAWHVVHCRLHLFVAGEPLKEGNSNDAKKKKGPEEKKSLDSCEAGEKSNGES